ncbi:MAG TPA: FtsW/RodA/SpoVE family cell cycle protein [Patescibacteria group bacterium]
MNQNGLPLKIDFHLAIPVLILLFVSLTTLFSINIDFFKSQLLYAIISAVIFIALSQINYKQLEVYSLPIYIISIVLLGFVLILGIESHGAVRWLDILGFRFQFSELLKPLLAICLAAFLSGRKSTSTSTMLLVFGLLLPIAFLIYKQPDLGNAIIYLLSTIMTLVIFGFPLFWFVIVGAVLLLSIPLSWNFLHQYQRERLLTFFHLTNDPLGISYNAIQSVIAVGSGMFWGKGLGQGTQSGLRFLPERHTDFIFATLSEELGFIGACIVILAFCYLLYRLFVLYKENDDMFAKTFIAATFSLLSIQFLVNIGMNIGVIPIVGVTLPFVSYGGSSLLSSAIFLGIVASMGKAFKRKNVLEIT